MLEEYLVRIQSWNILVAMLAAILGGIYLLTGWRLFKWLVILNALVLGMLVGLYLGTRIQRYPHMDVILALVGGILAAAMAWPLMKGAVSLMGALIGAVVGAGLWWHVARAMGNIAAEDLAWVGAIIGFITLGLLAFIVFQFVVIAFTALQGALMLVSGALSLALRHEPFRAPVLSALRENVYLLPLLVLVPAALGAIYQQAKYGKKPAKPKS